MNEWKRSQKGTEHFCSYSPSLRNELRSRSKPAPAYGREWTNNKAVRKGQKKGENGEDKKVEKNESLSSADLKAELSAAGCYGNSEARTALPHWLRCESQ